MYTDGGERADDGVALARALVPRWAQSVALLCAMVATVLATATFILFLCGILLVIDVGHEHTRTAWHTIIAVGWGGWLFLSLIIYLSPRLRGLLILPVVFTSPIAIIALASVDSGNVALLIYGLVLHCILAAAAGLMFLVQRIDSPLWWVRKRLARGECPRCRYDIRNLHSPRCPECGYGFPMVENARV